MNAMTLTDLFIEQGLVDPFPRRYILDGDSPPLSDPEEAPQNEEKSQA